MKTMENTEKLIIEQLKKGNEDIYRYIYDYHYGILCHVADQYVRDSFLAETIVGDVIFHIWEVRDSLQITTSLRSYLVKAVRNRCIGYMNLEYNQKEIAFSALLPEETPENRFIQSDDYPLGLLLEKELENEIYKSINKLPPPNAGPFLRKAVLKGKNMKKYQKN